MARASDAPRLPVSLVTCVAWRPVTVFGSLRVLWLPALHLLRGVRNDTLLATD